MKRITLEEAVDFIKSQSLPYEILKWPATASEEVEFINNDTQLHFFSKFNLFKRRVLLGDNFGLTKEQVSENRKKTNTERYGGPSPNYSKDVKEKTKKTNLEKYGAENPFGSFKIKEKIEKTNLQKYGHKNPSSSVLVREKRKQTSLQKYGAEYFIAAPKTREAIKKTNLQKYGSEVAAKNFKIREKINQTNIEKYGFKVATKNKQVANKISKTKQKYKVDNLTISQFSKNKKCAATTAYKIYHNQGPEFLASWNPGFTKIETLIYNLLTSINCSFVKNKTFNNGKIRCDGFIPDKNLVIECDGLYWHSDGCNRNKKHKSYHKEKRDFYSSQNFSSLFFREDEILNKFVIVESIIKNKLNLNDRIFARKCEILTCDSSFFEENHLMGKGSGRIYCLKFDNETVAAIQVKWKKKDEKILEISRFCTKNGISVIGGYSKLISHVEKVEKPNKIITFVDLRYGSGEYLESLGFKKKSEHLSFQWTDFKNTYHRMNFPGNSGYEHGLYKIWDCGQRLYEKTVVGS